MSASTASGPSSSDSAPAHTHQVSVSEEHHLTLSVDFDAVLYQPNLKLSFPVVVPGFTQGWSLYCQHEQVGDKYEFGLTHPAIPPGYLGDHMHTVVEFSWLDGGEERSLAQASYMDGPEPSFNSNTGDLSRGYRMDHSTERTAEWVRAYQPRLNLSEQQRYRLSFSFVQKDLQHLPQPHDVRLFFPRVGDAGGELWAPSAMLSASSPYFKDLLSSADFAESRSLTAADALAKIDMKMLPTRDHDDSDDETDAILARDKRISICDLSDHPSFSFRQINVLDTPYTTYQAVLRYLQTGTLLFAPLSSTCKPIEPSAKSDREAKLSRYEQEYTCAVTPASPKSVYRLAHFLSLPDLEDKCLRELRINLSPHNAAHELFDNASVLYDAWRQVVLEYVLKSWEEVSQASSWTDMLDRIERDEVPGSSAIMVRLHRAREAATKG
ncbi:hypothetical protein Rhopal_004246-T1 [Rhodotorula paludigena]|uniref:BTB domain-containing protein n=1 Tax=Rhodotorula paludigena TaxID=86838 RepID=A0AAV5GLY9_9BASI|nr:hypothetical protein Rhopal_004246-T1 [Rhodotorula paludigena]